MPTLLVHSNTRSRPADQQGPLNMKEVLRLPIGHGCSGASKSSNDNSVGPAEKVTKMRPREGVRAANSRRDPTTLVIQTGTAV